MEVELCVATHAVVPKIKYRQCLVMCVSHYSGVSYSLDEWMSISELSQKQKVHIISNGVSEEATWSSS